MSLQLVLAGKDYQIAALTIRQIRDLHSAALTPESSDPAEKAARSFDFGARVIEIALRTNEAPLTSDQILDLPIQPGELYEASGSVLRFAGLIPHSSGETASAAP